MTNDVVTRNGKPDPEHGLGRREFLGRAAAGTVGLSAGATLLAACGSSASSTTVAAGKPQNGGTLQLGIGGGGPADVMDPQVLTDTVDQVYASALFDQLTMVNGQMLLDNVLAEEISHNADATEWTIRVRDGVEFHNGKTLSAEDVIFTCNRLIDPKTRSTFAWLGALIGPMTKLDSRTVRFSLKQPVGWFDLAISGAAGIVPVGFDPHHPIGTGPFKYVSLTPGQQGVVERNPNYWRGPAHLDRIVVHTINDDDARFNALVTGEVDILQGILPSQAAQIRTNPQLQLYNSRSSGFLPFTMRVDAAPFSDVRVRQALRLCIDRTQMLEAAWSGYGTVGNDLYSPFDPDFDHSLVRKHDPEQAKALLKQAGHSNLNVQLTVGQLAPGLVQQAEVFAQNASQVGVKINIQTVEPATLYGPNYLSWPFATDDYPGIPYLTTSALADGPFASINSTHFEQPHYEQLWKEASSTTDANTRKERLFELQQILFDQGGFIIPVFPNAVAAASTKVGGFAPTDLRGFGPVSDNQYQLYLRS